MGCVEVGVGGGRWSVWRWGERSEAKGCIKDRASCCLSRRGVVIGRSTWLRGRCVYEYVHECMPQCMCVCERISQ